MKSNTIRRLLVVVAVTLLSVWLIYPTIRYFLAVGNVIPVSEEKLAELKAGSVPLGLDLQGGVDVLLAVDTEKTQFAKVNEVAEVIRKKFSSESPAIEGSVETTSGTADISVTVLNQNQVRAADNALADMEGYFNYKSGSLQANAPLKIEVNPDYLSRDIDATVDSSLRVIKDRVDGFGVTQPVIVRQGADRIRVQIPGANTPEKAIADMIRPAKLEFRGVYTTDYTEVDQEDGQPQHPDMSHELIDTKTGALLEGKRLPSGYEVVKSIKTMRGADGAAPVKVEEHIIVRKQAEMTGAGLKDAYARMGQSALSTNNMEVIVEFNEVGTRKFAELTEKYLRKPMAVMLDGQVFSYPMVKSVIDQGYCQITGSFTLEEAQSLGMVLKAGALPAELITKDMRTVEATLGADSISKSVMALAIGSVLIAIYMIVYYNIAGAIAVVAVLINVLLIFAFMKLANATLTLSGIGGILLTVGMAVDANVLIYERIREELRAGKTIKQAIELGYGKAFSVIFDANLTTLICGLVLMQFGEGSIQGFALSLNVGIIATLFTGLFVTKALTDVWFEKMGSINFGKLTWFKHEIQVDFLKYRKAAYIFSIVVFALCLLYVMPFVKGSNWGVDFEGGLLTEVQLNNKKDLNTEEIQGQYEGWRVQKVAGEDKFLVRTKLTQDNVTDADKTELVRRLDTTIGAGEYSILSSEAVSNEVGNEFTRKALIACLLASIGIMIYLAIRFEFVFGVAAVVAVIHDIVIAYGVFNLLGDMKFAGEVTLDVVAALLVVLGYSVNDTIIIFDRIRENRKLHPNMSDYKIINLSISESLNRTIMTVSTVVVVLTVMLVMGGSGLYDFALVLLIGVIKGTYSSLYVASSLVYFLHERARKQGKAITYRNTEQEVQPMLGSKR